MRKKILVTSALPYANGPLHFGHIAGAYLPGDTYSRFQRLQGNDVKYFCGSDEYGVAITMSADIAGRTPQEHVDIYHEVNKKLFETLNFSFDHYSRTTTSHHKEPSQQYFLDLLENGYIEKKETEQLYSEEEKKFLADRYVVGTCPKCQYDNARGDECQKCGMAYDATDLIEPRSKIKGTPLTLKKTTHWFLMLDKFKDRLLAWLETKDWKPNVVKFVEHYIEDLRPRAITRDSKWGIPVPLDDAEGKVLYVWFDAPIGYISSSMEWAEKQGKPDLWKEYWCDPDTSLVQFIGKDNIPFHAVIFPAMTMGQNQNYKIVDELPANEFYNLEGRKFSKSDGWYVDLEDFFTKYTPDQIRYTIASNAPETSDSEFCWKAFQMHCNAELLGKYGNFANRTLVFAKKNCSSAVPETHTLTTIDEEFLANIKTLADKAANHYETFSIRKASQTIMELAQLGNVYFDTKKPWVSAKEGDIQSLETTIACCIECLKTLAIISSPIIPTAAQKLWELLGYNTPLAEQNWHSAIQTHTPPKQPLPSPSILFNKIEDEQIDAELSKLKS
jgi:methionyl-tRNA synthetase